MARSDGNNRFVARMIDSHSVLGLAFAALIYVVSLSGALTLFVEEISLWETTVEKASVATVAEPGVYQAALENLIREKPAYASLQSVVLYSPGEFSPLMIGRLNMTDVDNEFMQREWLINTATAELGDPFDTPLADLIEELHVALHLPSPWGRYLVGVLGVCMFCLILSGILAHPTILRDAFKLRFERNKRIAWMDVHNRLSVWGLPYHLALTFTGAFLGIVGLVIGALAMVAYDGDQDAALAAISGPQPIEGEPMREVVAIDSMLSEVRGTNPDLPLELIVIREPQNAGGITQVTLLEHSHLASRVAFIYRNSGELLEQLGGEVTSAATTTLGVIQSLHYGTFGGYLIKTMYFLLALGLTWVTSTGMHVWFNRRQLEGRPVYRWRALWLGMTAGLSVGLSLAALATALGEGAHALAILLVSWPAFIVMSVCLQSRTGLSVYAIALPLVGFALLVAVIANASSGPHPDHAASLLVNVGLLVIAFFFLYLWVRSILGSSRVGR